MKSLSAILLALLLAAIAPLPAADTIAEVVTLRGRTFRQCEIVRVDPDGVSFRHSDGVAKVLFTDLSPQWRSRLGYDPAKAAAHAKEQQELAEKREENRKARAKVEEARFRELAEAAARARIQIMGQEALARAQARQEEEAAVFTPSVVPLLPVLGAVYDPCQAQHDYAHPRHFPMVRGQGCGWPAHGYGLGYGIGLGAGFQPPGPGFCHPMPPACPPLRTVTIKLPLR